MGIKHLKSKAIGSIIYRPYLRPPTHPFVRPKRHSVLPLDVTATAGRLCRKRARWMKLPAWQSSIRSAKVTHGIPGSSNGTNFCRRHFLVKRRRNQKIMPFYGLYKIHGRGKTPFGRPKTPFGRLKTPFLFAFCRRAPRHNKKRRLWKKTP